MNDNKCYISVLSDIEKDKCLFNKQIIVFGLGKNGKRVIQFALEHQYTILEIWDNNSDINNYNGIKVCRPHNDCNKNIPIIISVISKELEVKLYNQCKNLRYLNVLNYLELYIGEKISFNEYKRFFYVFQIFKTQKLYPDSVKSLVLKSVDLQITEKCSLKCKECSNLMQYFEKPQDLVFDEVMQDLDKLLKAVDYIEEIRVLGGEPFVSKDFAKYVNAVKQYKNIGNIIIYTNGTIVPKGENLECLKSPNVFLRISNYGEKLSRHLKQLEQTCDRENILYYTLDMDYWFKCASLDKHNRTDEENKSILAKCCMKYDPSIRNGLFFRCPFIANAWALKAIPQVDIEYIDLNTENIDLLRENIRKYMSQDLILGCDYCLGRSIDDEGKIKIPVAEQTKKPIKYNKYE